MGKLVSYIKDGFEFLIDLFKDQKLKYIKFSDLKEIDGKKHEFICKHLDENGKFADPDFKPDIYSFTSNDKSQLIDYNSILSKDELEKRNKALKKAKEEYETRFNKDLEDEEKILKWERISSIINIKDEKKNLKYKVKQNNIGDCYLISFLRGLKEFQEKRYWKLFGACIPEIGYYEIYFFNEKGENTLIYVDDYIIVDNKFKPYFASLDDKNKYDVGISILIEKAYAKLNGGYFNINGDYQYGDPLFYLTGFKTLNINNLNSYDNDDLYNTIKIYHDSKDVLTTGTPEAPTKIDDKGNEIELPFPISGIYYCHDYTVWKKFAKEKDIYIIEINNPWGENVEEDMEDFKLNLGKQFEKTEKEIIKYNKKHINSGEIKIDINNYKKYFYDIKICEFSKSKEKKVPIKAQYDPKLVPPEGLDDGTIKDLSKKRIGILDNLKIEKELQDKFLELFENNMDYGLYVLFKLFMTFGTRRDVFYIFMERITKGVNKQHLQINKTEESLNSLNILTMNIINLLKGNNK